MTETLCQKCKKKGNECPFKNKGKGQSVVFHCTAFTPQKVADNG